MFGKSARFYAFDGEPTAGLDRGLVAQRPRARRRSVRRVGSRLHSMPHLACYRRRRFA
jgi:hypothetical protein